MGGNGAGCRNTMDVYTYPEQHSGHTVRKEADNKNTDCCNRLMTLHAVRNDEVDFDQLWGVYRPTVYNVPAYAGLDWTGQDCTGASSFLRVEGQSQRHFCTPCRSVLCNSHALSHW